MKKQKILKSKITLIIFLTLVLTLSALGLISVNKVKANTAITPELLLPSSNLEYQELSNPVDAYSDSEITAILQEGKLIIYKNGGYEIITDTILEQAKQIKKLNSQKLLLSSGAITREVDIATGAISTFELNDSPVGSIFFDFNQKYLVTSAGTTAKTYTFDGSTLTDDKIVNTLKDSPIAINNNDEIFFVKDNLLKKHKINSADETTLANVIPSTIIANNDYVFYLVGSNIYKLSVNGGQPTLLTSPSSEFDLGKISNPQSLSFKGNNLLITGDNAVQEFRVTGDDKLEFTGFAIAKGKTAFNRISSTVTEIERENDRVATLDGDKLSLITVGKNLNSYDKANFEHYSIAQLAADNTLLPPKTFALGKNSCLLIFDYVNNLEDKVGVFTFGAETPLNTDINLNVKDYTDVVYQSGKYYILAHENTTSSTIFVSDENQINFVPLTTVNSYASIMEIDVFGNAYVYANDNNVYKLDKTQDYASSLLFNASDVIKLETDLGGNLFALTPSKMYYSDGSNWVSDDFATPSVKSFALDYDKKTAYLVYENEEYILKTDMLSNVAINDIVIPQTFVTTDKNASETFKTFKAKEGANVYSVNTSGENFNFNQLIKGETDYVLISEIDKNGVILYALVGQTDVVLINKTDLIETTNVPDTSVPLSAYTTTSVNGYYLPIITANDEYALTDVQTVRLNKEHAIKPKHKITFLEKEYYFAEFTIDSVTYSGYIPIDYTISVLSQDFKWDSYTVKKVSSTTVYKEFQLQTSITELKNDTEVRVIKIENGVAFIAYSTPSGWVNGYIKADNILHPENIAVRNILIIIAVMACVCGTATFFLLRKKK